MSRGGSHGKTDVYLSDAALWERYRDQHEQVRVGVTAIIPRNVVPDSTVSVTPQEVEVPDRQLVALVVAVENDGIVHVSSIAVKRCDRALPRCQNRQWEKEVAEKGHLW